MTDRLISIIIPKQQEQTYLVRCLNAIKRQTYQNYEIILVTEQCEEILQEYDYDKLQVVKAEGESKWSGMQQAIESAHGEYLYFCSVSSVLAPNVLEELLKNEWNVEKHSMGQFLILQEKNVTHADPSTAELGIYGKLFLNSRVQSEKIVFQEEMEFADYIFASFYERNYEKVEENTDVYIYETDKKFFCDTERMISGMEEESELLLVAQEDNRYFKKIVMLLENKISHECGADKILQQVSSIANLFPKEYEINYQLAKKYLKKIFDTCQEKSDEEIFQKFHTYFEGMESEENFFKILLTAFGLNEEKYGYLKECSLKEYLFFRDRVNEEKMQMEKKFLQLEESVKKLEDTSVSVKEEMKRITVEMDSVRDNVVMNTLQAVAEELTGPMLAEFVVNKYKNGGLGLKTLLMSLKVWIMYKFRKGK